MELPGCKYIMNATHANTNNSTILTNLETWYTNNLKTYESVIADTVWCNDKTNVTDTSYNLWGYSNVTGLGYGTNVHRLWCYSKISKYKRKRWWHWSKFKM